MRKFQGKIIMLFENSHDSYNSGCQNILKFYFYNKINICVYGASDSKYYVKLLILHNIYSLIIEYMYSMIRLRKPNGSDA